LARRCRSALSARAWALGGLPARRMAGGALAPWRALPAACNMQPGAPARAAPRGLSHSNSARLRRLPGRRRAARRAGGPRTLPRQSRQMRSWYFRCASSSATKSSSRSRKSAARCSPGRPCQYSTSACAAGRGELRVGHLTPPALRWRLRRCLRWLARHTAGAAGLGAPATRKREPRLPSFAAASKHTADALCLAPPLHGTASPACHPSRLQACAQRPGARWTTL